MEHFRRRAEFGVASIQRCHSLSCQTAESMQIDARNTAIRCKDKSRRSNCCHPAEMPVIPEQAMEFLSRTWSPSSSDLFQILYPSSLGTSPEDHHPEKANGDEEENKDKDEAKEEEERHLTTVHFGRGKSQFFSETWGVLAGEKINPVQRRRKLTQPTWLNVGHMKSILRGYFLNNISVTGSQRRRRKEDIRLQAAQAHAALSVAQLAAAIAGFVSVCELRPASLRSVDAADGKKMGTVLASAVALVATICAEAAETAGANRSRVTSAMKMGLENRSSDELLALTATAATCLRGAAALKLRADVKGISSSNPMAINTTSIQKGTPLRVCLPRGRVCQRTVAVFPQRGTVALRLGTKRLHGAFATYKEYEVLAVSGCGEAVVDGRAFFPVALSTAAGAVQLLLDNQTNCKVWKASIEDMLSSQKLKHAKC